MICRILRSQNLITTILHSKNGQVTMSRTFLRGSGFLIRHCALSKDRMVVLFSARVCKAYSTTPNKPSRKFSSTLNPTDSSNPRRLADIERSRKLKDSLHTKDSFAATSTRWDMLYQDDGLNLIGDLRQGPSEIMDQFKNMINRGFPASKSMRSFYFKQLFRSVVRGDLETFFVGLSLLEMHSPSLSKNTTQAEAEWRTNKSVSHLKSVSAAASDELKSQTLCYNLLVQMAVAFGDPLVGCSLALQAADSSAQISTEVLGDLVMALSVGEPIMQSYNSYAIFKIRDTFPRDYPLEVFLYAINNMASNGRNPFFANVLYDDLMLTDISCISCECKAMLISSRSTLLNANLNYGNYARAVDLWISNAKLDPAYCEKNILAFRRFLTRIPEKQMVKSLIFTYLPKRLYTHPDFIEFALSFFGSYHETQSEFEELADLITPPLQRNTLSSLFASFIRQNKEPTAKRILETIFQTQEGISPDDFDVIIEKLLSSHNFTKSVDTCLAADFSTSKKGSLRVLAFLLAHTKEPTNVSQDGTLGDDDFNKLKNSFFAYFIKNMSRAKQDTTLRKQFTALLFKHMSRYINNRASRKLYSKVSFLQDGEQESLHLDSYALPKEFETFLYVDDTNRIELLRIILAQARQERDEVLVNWCLSELHIAGITVADIKRYFMASS